MDRLRRQGSAFRLTKVNWRALFALELVFKFAATVSLAALLMGLMNLSMRVTGRSYLTRENLGAFFSNPVTVASLLIWLVLALTWMMIELGAIVYILDGSRQGVECRVEQALLASARNALRAWRPRNLPMVLALVGMLPFFSVGLGLCVATGVSMPKLIADSIRLNKPLYMGLLAGLLLLAFVLSRQLFAFHAFTLEGCDYAQARERSRALNGRRMMNYLRLLAGQVLFGVVMMLCGLAMVLLGLGLEKLLPAVLSARLPSGTLVWYGLVLALVFAFAAALPFSCACVEVLNDRAMSEQLGLSARHFHQRLTQKVVPVWAMRIVMAALLVASALGAIVLIGSGAANPRIESLRVTEITAHRGASAVCPENTMSAFRAARELGADWVELDVQQTRDGRIVVMHDSNTKRTTGVKGNVWNMTYDEIARLDAGRLFSREFAGERIPLLSEVAEYAKQTGLRLNIELKPTGHETDFEQSVIDVVKECGIEDRCVITSQVYRVLTNVKALDENLTTVYVTSFAYGSIDRLTAADHFSVEETSTTRRLVSRVHDRGGQIYAWTVNTRKGMERMIARNVDNIITDEVALARQCVLESRYSGLVTDIVDIVNTLEGEE